MMSSVPQFTDVEDKIAGPLTWRQILWMIGMGGVLLVLYNILNSAAFFVAAIPVILVFSLFAFYRPNGVSMLTFSYFAIFYFFRPKVSVWERTASRPSKRTLSQASAPSSQSVSVPEPKRLSQQRLKELAKMLDGGA